MFFSIFNQLDNNSKFTYLNYMLERNSELNFDLILSLVIITKNKDKFLLYYNNICDSHKENYLNKIFNYKNGSKSNYIAYLDDIDLIVRLANGNFNISIYKNISDKNKKDIYYNKLFSKEYINLSSSDELDKYHKF